jgi:pimeloyl-ACP methyl ester carboxylesterase
MWGQNGEREEAAVARRRRGYPGETAGIPDPVDEKSSPADEARRAARIARRRQACKIPAALTVPRSPPLIYPSVGAKLDHALPPACRAVLVLHPERLRVSRPRLLAALATWFVAGMSVLLPAQAPSITARDVDLSGRRIHYLEAGSGPAVVLLHGLGADARTWRYVIPALAATRHVYALDQLGFGQSDKPQIAYRINTLVDSLSEFLTTVGVEKPALVGNSLGGWVAAKFAASHPERVDKLVLVDAAGYAEDPAQLIGDLLSQMDPAMVAAAEQMLRSLSPTDQRRLEAAAASYFARRSPRGDGYAAGALAESIVRGEDLLGPELKQLAVPTLVVWGQDDRVISVRAGDALAADIPGARKIVLDHCGHRPQTECSAAFNAALLPYLTGLSQ